MARRGVLLSAMLLLPTAAFATAFQLEARTEAQVSSMRSYRQADPSTPVLLPRRRLVQYLGLNAYELLANQPLGFESSLRVFADFGTSQAESQIVDGLRSQDADLLYANVVYRGERFGVKVGRQTYTDLMDITAFDGAWVRYLHPVGGFRIGAEAYGGLWVKAGAALSSTVYQPDGIRESDLRRVAAGLATPYSALDDVEPLVGAKLLLENLFGVSASAAYRQAWLSGKTDVQRMAFEARWGQGRGLNLLGGVEYDFVTARVSNARALARLDLALLAVTAEYLRISPVLSADSIFLYFANAPRDGFRARVDVHPPGLLRFYAQGVADLYSTPVNSNSSAATTLASDPTVPSPVSLGGGGGAALKAGQVRAGLDGTYKTGWGGRQAWVDLSAGWVSESGRVTADVRLTWANIVDGLSARLNGNFFGGQLWGSYLFTRGVRASLVLEQNVGALTRSDTKVFVLLDLKALL